MFGSPAGDSNTGGLTFALVSGRLVRDGCTLSGWGWHGRLGLYFLFALLLFAFLLLCVLAFLFSFMPILALPWPRVVVVLVVGGYVVLCDCFYTFLLSLLFSLPPLCLRCGVWCWPVAVRTCPPWAWVVGGVLRLGVRRRRYLIVPFLFVLAPSLAQSTFLSPTLS